MMQKELLTTSRSMPCQFPSKCNFGKTPTPLQSLLLNMTLYGMGYISG